jgi:hypothetical protein
MAGVKAIKLLKINYRYAESNQEKYVLQCDQLKLAEFTGK